MPKGIYLRTKEHNDKISKSLKGKKSSEETKKKIGLERIKRKKRLGYLNSIITRKKISKAKLGKPILKLRGKPKSEEHKRKMSLAKLGKRLSEEHKKKISENSTSHRPEVRAKIIIALIKHNKSGEHRKLARERWSGENNPKWKGGITPLNKLLRMNSKWKIWRELVFLRDNFTCQNPNCKYCKNKIGVKLNAHHTITFSEILKKNKIKTIEEGLNCHQLWDINNGITYCAEFHLKSNLHPKKLIKELKNG